MNFKKVTTSLKILISPKFYWYIFSELIYYFSKIIVRYEMLVNRGNIILGRTTYIDKTTNLISSPGSRIEIGDQTSVNGNCVIIGDVKIERYCLLSYNIYISSGNHQVKLQPHWLIRDQDEYCISQSYPENNPSRVHIEEDCWIGWGVFIKQGIYIGKGAVIGASTVVTRDVPPYSIQVGIPNREISTRLNFDPPSELDSANDHHWPYFYSGFLLRQKEIKRTAQSGMLMADKVVRVLVRGGSFQKIFFSGNLSGDVEKIRLNITHNGVYYNSVLIDSASFEVSCYPIDIQSSDEGLPRSQVLAKFNELEIEVSEVFMTHRFRRPSRSSFLYGIKTLSVS